MEIVSSIFKLFLKCSIFYFKFFSFLFVLQFYTNIRYQYQYGISMKGFKIFVFLSVILVLSVFACEEGSLLLDGICAPIDYIPGCVKYGSAKSCQLCEYGSVAIAGECQQLQKPTSLCCTLVDTAGNCLQCAPGLYLLQGSCIKYQIPGCLEAERNIRCVNCAINYKNINGKCIKKINYCKKYDQNGVCNQCQFGYQARKGLCSQIITRKLSLNCKEANQYGCIKCQQGYYLTKSRQCKLNQIGCLMYYQEVCQICSVDFRLINGKCLMDGCTQYSLNGCSKCAASYDLVNGKCLIQNCLVTQEGKCLVCNSQFRLRSGVCIKPIQDKCTNCANGYLIGQNGNCLKILAGCSYYDNNGKCRQCTPPFQLNQGLCLIPGCQKSGLKDCQKCRGKLQLDNGKCQLAQCEQYNYLLGECKRCINGNYVSKGLCKKNDQLCQVYIWGENEEICGRCRSSNYILSQSYTCTLKIPGCVYQNGKCITCAYPFKKVAESICQIDGCTQYNLSGCERCASPFQVRNGICTINNCNEVINNKCSRCSSGYHITRSGFCIQDDPKCSNYIMEKCQKCVSGYFFSREGDCVRKISSCRTQNGQQCSECEPGYKLDNGICIVIDKYCETYDDKLGGCVKCFTGYHSQSGVCKINENSCSSYEKLGYSQKCQKCGEGYVFSEGNRYCIRAIPGCIFNSAGQCSSCISPFTFNGKTCFIYGCNQYSVVGCSKCVYPSVLQDSKCVIPFCENYQTSSISCQNCKAGYLNLEGQCYRQDNKCVEYSKAGICSRCIKQFVPFQGICVKEDIYCLKYSKEGGCNKCRENYYLAGNFLCSLEQPGCIYQKGICTFCNYPFKFDAVTKKCKIDGCLEANKEGCIKCNYPYKENKFGLCQIPNCVSALDNRCYRCSPGYHVKSGMLCVKDSSSCLKYNEDGDCELCDKGFSLMSTGQCQLSSDYCIEKSSDRQCTNCKPDYFLNKFFQCQKKDKNCQQYNNGYCVLCNRRHFLYEDICFPYSLGCVDYRGKDCIKCKNSYSLKNGQCFNLKKPLLKIEGDDEKYDFEITPIDVTKSKYYIDNLSPISKIGKIYFSSSFSSQFADGRLNSLQDNLYTKGWKAQYSRSGQYLGYIVNDDPVTFYAIQLEGVDNNFIKTFYLEYSLDGVNFVKVEKEYNAEDSQKKILTIYFTGIYAKSIRIVVKSYFGWPATRIQFFYYDALRFKKISNLKSLKYLRQSIQSNFVDRVDNQLYINQRLFFSPSKSCQNKTVCFTGLELCQARTIRSIKVRVNQGTLKKIYLTYSIDGTNYNCFEKCRHILIGDKQSSNQVVLNRLLAKNLRVYPVQWLGVPNIKIEYDYQ